MTLSIWLMILTFTIGPGTSQLTGTETEPDSIRPPTKIAGNCWVNGQWINPCPDDAPPLPPDREPLIPQPY